MPQIGYVVGAYLFPAGVTTTTVAGITTTTLVGAAAVTASVVNALVVTAFSTIAGRLLAPSPPGSSGEGYKDSTRGTIEPRKVVYGQRVISGPVVFIATNARYNKSLHLIHALTTHPVEDITHIIIGEDVINIQGHPGYGLIQEPNTPGQSLAPPGQRDDCFRVKGGKHYIGDRRPDEKLHFQPPGEDWREMSKGSIAYPWVGTGGRGEQSHNESPGPDKWAPQYVVQSVRDHMWFYSHPPLSVIKVNGWAAANTDYVPNPADPDLLSENWFSGDIKNQKRISQFIEQSDRCGFNDQQTVYTVLYPDPVDDVRSLQASNSSINGEHEKWTVNHRLTNCAHVYIKLNYNAEQSWRQSIPNIRYLVRGKRVYDPTDDDTTDYYDPAADAAIGRVDEGQIEKSWHRARGQEDSEDDNLSVPGTNIFAPSNQIDGSQRFDNPATWKWTDNWAACIADYMKDQHYGMKLKVNGPVSGGYPQTHAVSELDWDSVADAIRDAGEGVTQGFLSYDIDDRSPPPAVYDWWLELFTGLQRNPVSIPRYTINAVLQTNNTPLDIFEAMLKEGAGYAVFAQGAWKIVAGVYKPPSDINDHIDESWLAEGGLTVTTSVPLKDLFNKAEGTYVRAFLDQEEFVWNEHRQEVPVNKRLRGYPQYEATEFPVVDADDGQGNNPYEVEDGEERIKTFDFPFTTNEFEAQRLAKVHLEKSRRSIVVSGNFKLDMFKFSVGDRVYMTNELMGWSQEMHWEALDPNYTGLGPKQFKITAMNLNENLTVDVSFIEESGLFYEFLNGQAIPDDAVAGTSLDLNYLTAKPVEPIWDITVDSTILPISSFYRIKDDSGLQLITTLNWESSPNQSNQSIQIEGFTSTSHYQLEYGQVIDSTLSDEEDVAENRVANWIPYGNVPLKEEVYGYNELQGHVEIVGLDNSSQSLDSALLLDSQATSKVVRYDFRVRAKGVNGNYSDWSYYMDSLSAPADGYGYPIHIDDIAPPVPSGLTIEVEKGADFFTAILDLTTNSERDNAHVALLASKNQNDPFGAESQTYLFDIARDFSRLLDASKIIEFSIVPIDYDPWYIWTSVTDTSGNGADESDPNAWYPALTDPGVEGQLDPIYTYYIRPLRGTGITEQDITLGIQATAAHKNIDPFELTSGDIQFYIKDSAGDLVSPPGVGNEYLWDPITRSDISGNLTVYLATVQSGEDDIIHDTITLADATDQTLVAFTSGIGKLLWKQDSQGQWVDTTDETPSYEIWNSGILEAKQDFTIILDQQDGTLSVDLEDPYTPYGGNFDIEINAVTPMSYPYDAGGTANITVTYTAVSGLTVTLSENWVVLFDGTSGPPGDRVITVLRNRASFPSPYPTGDSSTGNLYVHGFDANGTPVDGPGSVFYDGNEYTVNAGSIRAAGTRLDPWGIHQAPSIGWIVFETAGGEPFNHPGTRKDIGCVVRTRNPDKFWYDDGSHTIAPDAWTDFVPTDTMVVIGTYETSTDNAVDQAVISPTARSMSSIPFEHSTYVQPGDPLPRIIFAEHIAGKQINYLESHIVDASVSTLMIEGNAVIFPADAYVEGKVVSHCAANERYGPWEEAVSLPIEVPEVASGQHIHLTLGGIVWDPSDGMLQYGYTQFRLRLKVDDGNFFTVYTWPQVDYDGESAVYRARSHVAQAGACIYKFEFRSIGPWEEQTVYSEMRERSMLAQFMKR